MILCGWGPYEGQPGCILVWVRQASFLANPLEFCGMILQAGCLSYHKALCQSTEGKRKSTQNSLKKLLHRENGGIIE